MAENTGTEIATQPAKPAESTPARVPQVVQPKGPSADLNEQLAPNAAPQTQKVNEAGEPVNALGERVYGAVKGPVNLDVKP